MHTDSPTHTHTCTQTDRRVAQTAGTADQQSIGAALRHLQRCVSLDAAATMHMTDNTMNWNDAHDRQHNEHTPTRVINTHTTL